MKELVPNLADIDCNIVNGITADNVSATKIPDFGSLAACAQECGKAVFEVEQEDTALINNGVKWSGATWNDAKNRMKIYEKEFEKIYQREAYQLEVAEAKYPRIVISPDMKEFYRDGRDKQKLKMILQEYKDNLPQYTARIREKYEWLFEYWEFIFKEKLTFNQQRFRIK